MPPAKNWDAPGTARSEAAIVPPVAVSTTDIVAFFSLSSFPACCASICSFDMTVSRTSLPLRNILLDAKSAYGMKASRFLDAVL